MKATFAPLAGLLALTLVAVAGCQPDEHGVRTYCDDTGCYRCDHNDDCSQIPNRRCTADSQCKDSQRCTTIGCAKACTTDHQCDKDDHCTNGFCAPKGFNDVKPYVAPKSCAKDTDCDDGQVCGDTKKCQAACKSDDQCGPNKVCAPCGKCQQKGVPATCGANIKYCSTQGSCGIGKSCEANRCHFNCTTSNTCPTGQVCSDKGYCKDDPDPKNAECALDLDCTDGACINGYCHPSCKTSLECGDNELCLMGACQPDYFANLK